MMRAGGSTGLWETASVAMALTLASALAVALALGNQPYRAVERIVRQSEPEPLAFASAARPRAATPAEAADFEMSERISAHIDCLNFASRDVLHARRSYFTAVDAATGPSGTESGVWLGATDLGRCAKALEKARTLKPALPELDRASDAYLASLEELAPALNDASAYYTSKGYERDDWAKAKAMHPGLVAAFSDFEKAHAALEDQVHAIYAGLFARRLERLQEQPSARLEYLAAKTVNDARALVNLASGPNAAPLDGASYRKALSQYETAAADYERYVDAHPDEARRVDSMSLFRSQVSALLKSATALLHGQQGGAPPETKNPELELGQPANLVTEFNELVSRANRMKFPR